MLARLMFIWKACHHAKIATAAGFQELPVGGDDINRLTANLAQY
jgi:hypothetical protein